MPDARGWNSAQRNEITGKMYFETFQGLWPVGAFSLYATIVVSGVTEKCKGSETGNTDRELDETVDRLAKGPTVIF